MKYPNINITVSSNITGTIPVLGLQDSTALHIPYIGVIDQLVTFFVKFINDNCTATGSGSHKCKLLQCFAGLISLENC